MAEDDLKALEGFVLNNPDLERLEAMLDDFNPFVAMGWTRQELRHSHFLRWLLDPEESHGLGPYFLRRFLKLAAAQTQVGSAEMPTVVDLDSWAYSNTTVHAEWNKIDLFIRDDSLNFVCAIENKVDSTEHGGQLQKYLGHVQDQFPAHKKLFIYLTIDGSAATEESYVALSHAQVANLVEETVQRRHDQLSPEVKAFMLAYVEMVRRNIVEESEIQSLCDKIYKSHRKALDILFEHRPDLQSNVRDYLVGVIANHPALELDRCSKGYVRFIPKAWDSLPKACEIWTSSKRVILCEADQTLGGMRLKVILSSCDEALRSRIVERIKSQGAHLNKASSRVYPQWWTFHAEEWASRKLYEDGDLEKLKERIRESFDSFVKRMAEVQEVFTGL